MPRERSFWIVLFCSFVVAMLGLLLSMRLFTINQTQLLIEDQRQSSDADGSTDVRDVKGQQDLASTAPSPDSSTPYRNLLSSAGRKVTVLDPTGQPVAGWAYKAEAPDSKPIIGVTSNNGEIRVPGESAGEVHLRDRVGHRVTLAWSMLSEAMTIYSCRLQDFYINIKGPPWAIGEIAVSPVDDKGAIVDSYSYAFETNGCTGKLFIPTQEVRLSGPGQIRVIGVPGRKYAISALVAGLKLRETSMSRRMVNDEVAVIARCPQPAVIDLIWDPSEFRFQIVDSRLSSRMFNENRKAPLSDVRGAFSAHNRQGEGSSSGFEEPGPHRCSTPPRVSSSGSFEIVCTLRDGRAYRAFLPKSSLSSKPILVDIARFSEPVMFAYEGSVMPRLAIVRASGETRKLAVYKEYDIQREHVFLTDGQGRIVAYDRPGDAYLFLADGQAFRLQRQEGRSGRIGVFCREPSVEVKTESLNLPDPDKSRSQLQVRLPQDTKWWTVAWISGGRKDSLTGTSLRLSRWVSYRVLSYVDGMDGIVVTRKLQ